LTFYFILNIKDGKILPNYIGMAASFTAAVLFFQPALYMVPMILLYSIHLFIKKKKTRIPMIIAPVAGVLLFFLISMPFFWLEGVGGSFGAGWTAILGQRVYALNAFNFQALLQNNFRSITTESMVVTSLFIAFIYGVIALGYFKSGNKLDFLLLSALAMAAMWSFTNRMSPTTMYMVLPMLFIFGVLAKEKRAFALFIAYSVIMLINAGYVNAISGYTEGIQHEVSGAFVIWMSIFNLITTGYFVYLTYDIVGAKKFAYIAVTS
jgi:hypothetical protein